VPRRLGRAALPSGGCRVTKADTVSLDELAQAAGFEDAEEMRYLVLMVAQDTEHERRHFEAWREHDGTKTGLLELLGVSAR